MIQCASLFCGYANQSRFPPGVFSHLAWIFPADGSPPSSQRICLYISSASLCVTSSHMLHANVLLFSPDDPDLGPDGRAPSGQSLAWNIVSTQTLEKKYQCSTATPPARQLFASAWDIKYKPRVWFFFLLTHQRNALYDKNDIFI